MNRLQRWWHQRFLRKHRIPLPLWESALSQAAILTRLDPAERHRLRELASRFLHDKSIVGAQGLTVTDDMRVMIAAQACLLILNLDLDYFDGWQEIIVYPDSFIVSHEERDEAGVVHSSHHALGGEAWGQGPVILSWGDAQPGDSPTRPRLQCHPPRVRPQAGHVERRRQRHAAAARRHVASGLDRGTLRRLRRTLSATAGTSPHCHRSLRRQNPAEFFAVLTETFFELPQLVHETYPQVYKTFKQFYRQDPLSRMQTKIALKAPGPNPNHSIRYAPHPARGRDSAPRGAP